MEFPLSHYTGKIVVAATEEQIENAYIKWRHTNKYWVDQETGFVLQSYQVIAPNLPPILIQITKKPSL